MEKPPKSALFSYERRGRGKPPGPAMLGGCAPRWFARLRLNSGEQARLNALGAKIVQRLKHRVACAFLATWVRQVQESKHKRALVIRVTLRMQSASAYRTWIAWEEATKNLRRQRHLLKKTTLHMMHSAMFPAWAKWCDMVKERRHLRGLMQTVVFRMQHVLLFKIWTAWNDKVREQQRLRSLIHKTFLRMRGSKLLKALATWAENTEELIHQRIVLERCRLRMLHFLAHKAWVKWACWCANINRYRSISTHIVKSWRRGTMVKAWTAWNDTAANKMEVSWTERNHLLPRGSEPAEVWEKLISKEFLSRTRKCEIKGACVIIETPRLSKDLPVTPPSKNPVVSRAWSCRDGGEASEREKLGGRVDVTKNDSSSGLEKRVLKCGKEMWVQKTTGPRSTTIDLDKRVPRMLFSD